MGDMFKKDIDELFSSMLNVFGIVEDSLIAGVGQQGRDHNEITFSPATAEVCEPLHKLTTVEENLTWNKTYIDLYEKAKTIFKIDT